MTTDLKAEVERWLEECGACDVGLSMGCTCPKGDYRSILLKLWVAYEVQQGNAKALAETATRLGRELGKAEGRKEAGEEIALALEQFAADDIRGRADMSIDRAASIARSIASRPQEATSEPLTASTGHSDLPETAEGLEGPHVEADASDGVVDLVGRLREAVDAARIRRTTPRIPGGEG